MASHRYKKHGVFHVSTVQTGSLQVLFLFSLFPSSWHPTIRLISSVWREEGGFSGKLCPGPNTCLTVMFTLELWMYLEHTSQSSSDTGSSMPPICWAKAQVGSSKHSACCGGAGRIRGTAWYSSRLGPDINITSPLCMNIAVGGSCLWGPPSRKIADCPKLFRTKPHYWDIPILLPDPTEPVNCSSSHLSDSRGREWSSSDSSTWIPREESDR